MPGYGWRGALPPQGAARVTCGFMPDRHGAGGSTDSFMGTIVLVLATLLYILLARASGLGWKGVLHWAGEALLVAGILLAAVGISDVRSEWTQLPGIRGRARQVAQAIRIRVVSLMWAGWNRIAQQEWLAKRLNLRPHKVDARSGAVSFTLQPMRFDATGTVDWGPPPAAGTPEERLAWLEERMTDAGAQLGRLFTGHWHEVRERKADTKEERAARIAEDQRIRERMANLAGGGLRLQTWGVVCLLAGTVMTAIW